MEANTKLWKGNMPNLKRYGFSKPILTALTVGWLILVGAGFISLAVYQHGEGEIAERESTWVESGLIQHDANQCQLLVFLHPRCACSLATLNELARIQSRCKDRLSIQVVIYHPSSAEADWLQSPNVKLIKQIPNVRWTLDLDGSLAQQFGVRTSGHAMLFSPKGDVVFSGGITPARAHEGDNLGKQAIERYVCLGEKSVEESNVYGCPIFGISAPEKVTVQSRKSPDGVK